MEAVEEIPVPDLAPNISKAEDSDVVEKESNEVCESNGVECNTKSEESQSDISNVEEISVQTANVTDEIKGYDEHCSDVSVSESVPHAEQEVVAVIEIEEKKRERLKIEVANNDIDVQQNAEETEAVETVVTEIIVEDFVAESEPSKQEIITEIDEEIVVPTNSSVISEDVKFETEILIEENDVNENVLTSNDGIDSSTYILKEIAPNLELSEALTSSDVADNSENNNSTDKHEVFNKEELLDILEGNDANQYNANIEPMKSNSNKLTEVEIALKQLSKLKEHKRKKNKKKIVERAPKANVNSKPHKVKPVESISDNKLQTTEQKKNIVNVLVMDWEDEEIAETTQSNDVIDESEELTKESEASMDQETIIIISQEGTDEHSTKDSMASDDTLHASVKSEDECRPRRLSRVIKKKVIFDPDNPDTFTKGKTPAKTKEVCSGKDSTPSKKLKLDQTVRRSESKSPLSKLQWKKPPPKNSKQNKRLSEVDKLLMDEGAVNMIYQLTEAPKGKKNMRTKAEFIKKLQSSTPEGKEMKFRERKKELIKYEDGEPKKILSGKQRESLSSSVKSPFSEDFETHSADDSIIYRRHSSSSYSSSCMSTHRLSDVEAGSTNSNTRMSQQTTTTEIISEAKANSTNESDGQQAMDMFNPESDNKPASEIMNKSDCMSIKEKLNSKLSLALNKRKREASKTEKSMKQKKVMKTVEQKDVQAVPKDEIDRFNFVSITLDQRLAIISIQNTGEKIGVEVLKELEMALNYIDKRKDISITMFSSQCGSICSILDLALLVNKNRELRAHHALELAESIKCVLSSAARHSKLVWSGVSGACSGVALALAALSDVALAAEGASFSLGASPALLPGPAALAARPAPLAHALVKDLVIFGRRLSASEAMQGGLISRVLYPDKFDEQVLNIARDVAAQPLQILLLKKRLLNINNSGAGPSLIASLESERDLFVEHWTSIEGQELLRAALDAA